MLKNKIDKKELTNLDNALKIRNEVVHNGKVPSAKEVKDVLTIACLLSTQLFFEQWPSRSEQSVGVCPFVTITENFWTSRKGTQQKNRGDRA